jgi:uncharacterized phage protein (TIGR02218 family)
MSYFIDYSSPIAWRLCMLRPDWLENAVSVAHQFGTQEVETVTGIESRTPTREAYRIRLTQTFILNVDEVAALRACLASLGEMRLAFPLWVDDLPTTDYMTKRIYSSQYWLSYNDAGDVAINDATYPMSVGLVIGRIVELPQIQPVNGESAEVTITIQEDSPWEMRVNTNATPPATFDFTPDWTSLIDESKWRIQSEEIGHGREAAISGQESIRKLGQEAGFQLMDRDEIAELIAFFEAKRGAHTSFTLPVWFNPQNSSASSITGKFGDDTLTVDYGNPAYATCTIPFWEQLGLIEGQPTQERPARAMLYRMQFEGATPRYYTDWEKPLSLSSPSATFLPDKITHKSFTQTMEPKSDHVELTMDKSPGCPLLGFVLLELERKLNLTIWECDPADTSTAVVIFDGQVLSAKGVGRQITATAATHGDMMNRMIPRHQIQTTCNYALGDELCGIDLAARKVTGTVVFINNYAIDVQTGDTSDDDYFTQGWALFGSGDTAERRALIRSQKIPGGQRLFTHKPLKQTGSIPVEFYPGCDGQYSTCGDKFNNAEVFGGFPFTPDYIETVSTGYKPKLGK